jgi:hypothetical protein
LLEDETMDRSSETTSRNHRSHLARIRALTIAFASLLAAPLIVDTQGLDICGCATVPGLQPFDSRVQATYPPGTAIGGPFNDWIIIPVPDDGIFKFSSFFVQNLHPVFKTNAANTPVTILVAGDVTVNSTNGCCYTFILTGSVGTNGNGSVAGVGALGGPGGFRGGDGAQQATSGFNIAGAGFGPGGGLGGAPPLCAGGTAQFFGSPDMIPMLGGGGGGGGCSTSSTPTSCAGGGGGGGGGALTIAANGTFSINNFRLMADGGTGGSPGNGSCSSGGAGGSGGSIRLLANRFVTTSAAEAYARGGVNPHTGVPSGAGRIRLESMDTSAQTALATDPPAQRLVGPAPLASPISPTVSITSVGGAAVPAVPQGTFGSIDVVVPVPGATNIDLATTGIPGGTTVRVTVKARLGALPVSADVPLSTCNAAGNCQATAVFNLVAGAYVVEARATFQTQ